MAVDELGDWSDKDMAGAYPPDHVFVAGGEALRFDELLEYEQALKARVRIETQQQRGEG